MNMVAGILMLAVLVFGLQILFGQARPENYVKFLVWLIFAPLLLAIGLNHASWFWVGLPLWAQVLSLLTVPFLFSAVLRVLFPKSKGLQRIQAVLYQTLVYLVTFPFRLMWRAGRLFILRERNNVRLNPYRPVVGGQPPIRREPERPRNGHDRFEW